MRKPIIAGNWKMNKNYDEAVEFIKAVADKVPSSDKVETAICAPALYLRSLVEHQGENLRIGAQNMHFEANGAFTGEIAPGMLKDLGVTYVILGHSERREMFNETDETVNKKTHAAFANGLVPIVCCGESLEERENGTTNQVVDSQIKRALEGLSLEQVKEKLEEHQEVTPELQDVIKSFGKKQAITLEDRNNYIKWTKEFGFTHGTIKEVAKSLKG